MQINLFAEETQLQKLTKLGGRDSLEKLSIIDFTRSSLYCQQDVSRRKCYRRYLGANSQNAELLS